MMIKNLEVLKTIVTEKEEYFLANKDTYRYNGKVDNSVWIIGVNYNITGKKWEELKIVEVEQLCETEINMNIPLTNNYPPFQRGIRLCEFNWVFPIPGDVNKFMKEALKMEPSFDIWKYKALMDELNKENEKQ